MNFLAHCWLGRCDDGLVAGGFIGDFVKGRVPDHLPESLQAGIRLHRHIDSVSNRLEAMRATYPRFGPELRRVAPVLLDLVCDHLLARHWSRHGEGELSDFTNDCYVKIGRYTVPETAAGMYRRMLQTDLWSSYADFEFMQKIMFGILKRLRLQHLAPYIRPLESQLDGFYGDFCTYFPLLENAAHIWVQENVKHTTSINESANLSLQSPHLQSTVS